MIANDTELAAMRKRVASLELLLQMGLIRFRGQFPKGGYDVHDGKHEEPASASAVHG